MRGYLWEFEVDPDHAVEFEAAYGPEGDWARLFRRSPAYLGTELWRDAGGRRYWTLDRWRDSEAFAAFRALHGADYAALDARCERLTTGERKLGELEIVTGRGDVR